MALSWNEIKARATKFSKEWEGTYNEDADAKPFLDDFFNVFGLSRKKVASFEHRVKKLDEHEGYIDLLWKGTLLIEMKSQGKDLIKAYRQAKDYLTGLKDFELPKYILISDFKTFRLTDLEEEKTIEFSLNEFVKNVQHFGFIAGYQKRTYKEQDPVNIKAAELMSKLHDQLKAVGYEGHPLEVYLVRLLFCLFAEDTTIFEKDNFIDFIEQRTNADGSDLASKLSELFFILNTPKENRLKNIDEQLNGFPFVNGKLFHETLPPAAFDSDMRNILLECCALNWGQISPAIFGSMFQSVMNPLERRNLGAHYTSEKNILKLIKPLFLDELWKEFETIKGNKNKLTEFHKKLSTLKFLDPACGCGNFLVITYRELRLLEMEILRVIYKKQMATSIESIIWLDVDMMYGIEYEEFPARIAEVAMWLIDHQMNMAISQEFGQYFVRLPLKKAANIVQGNALRIEWQSLLNPVNAIDVYANHTNVYLAEEPETAYQTLNVQTKSVKVHRKKMPEPKEETRFNYILGNPPFVGHQWRSEPQMMDMELVFSDAKRAGRLDYVAAWYLKAAEYIQNTKAKVAFVSTNSIVQGEQTSILWKELFYKYKIKIHFAHRTFSWSNEAKDNATVHVVIIGFACYDINEKLLFDYENFKRESHLIKVKNINAYLVEGKEIFIESRGNPIHKYSEMFKGSQPTDGGYLIINSSEGLKEFTEKEPKARKFIRRYMGAEDFIDNNNRWCLWLKNADPKEIKSMGLVMERLSKVRETRLKSPTPSVNKAADFPYLFTQDRQPESDYLVVPEVSSENRKYIPIGFESKDVICANTVQIIPNASVYMFGVMQSTIHMTWARTISGRLESRIRYTPSVYNNFPFPKNPSDKQTKTIEKAAQNVLDVRAEFPDNSLADLYDLITMPSKLVKAHHDLDKAVDMAYRPQPFTTDAKRMEFLFELYEMYTADLFTVKAKKKR